VAQPLDLAPAGRSVEDLEREAAQQTSAAVRHWLEDRGLDLVGDGQGSGMTAAGPTQLIEG